MMGNGWGMGWIWFIWPLIMLGIILLGVFVVRGTRTGTPGHGGEAAPPAVGESGRSRAQEILDERYAPGELSDEEYQQRLRQLRESPGGDSGAGVRGVAASEPAISLSRSTAPLRPSVSGGGPARAS